MKMIAVRIGIGLLILSAFQGCWAAAAGVGAEGGYILSQEDRSAGETIDDQRIVSSVKAKLVASSEVSGFDINVDSYKGVVTLKGVVDTNQERNEAIRLAQNVSGVKGVTSKLFLAD